jgi:general secretion pathway protein F
MKFVLTAVDSRHQVVAFDLDGPDERTVRELAETRGYAVITVKRKGLFALPASERGFSTTLFSIELHALLEAGLNVVEALQTLAEKETKPKAREILTGLLDSLFRGQALSQALEGYSQFFSPLYIATIRSSERTGDVKQALARYITYQEDFERVRKKLFAALLYPAILVVVGALVLCFLILYVVPRFARVYDDAAIELPFFSGLLLALGRWIEHNGIAAALALAAIVTACLYAASRPNLRAAFLAQLYQSSSAGMRLRVYQLGRFYRTVAMLLKAGVPALKAFEMVSSLLPPHMQIHLADASASLREGKQISVALTSAGLATPVATRMLAVGERGGQMGEMMDRISRFCDEETARFVDSFTRVFEPLLMAILGLAVGAVVVLMYMPIFELAGSIR